MGLSPDSREKFKRARYPWWVLEAPATIRVNGNMSLAPHYLLSRVEPRALAADAFLPIGYQRQGRDAAGNLVTYTYVTYSWAGARRGGQIAGMYQDVDPRTVILGHANRLRNGPRQPWAQRPE